MDTPEEDLDIKLQKISSDLIVEFDRSLSPFLRREDGGGQTVVRSRVRTRETDRLISLLDPFQELPQLLDPHLPRWLPFLGEAFLEYHHLRQTTHRGRRAAASSQSTRSELLTTLSAAISRLLYTLCKIRGEKVIVRFLNNETRYLELLLSALEETEPRPSPSAPAGSLQGSTWTWEERYVTLLWLSQLMFAPFDLASISSTAVEDDDELPAVAAGFVWPAPARELPGITVRILPLAIKYLASPGKERDAAKALLVRIAMRKDMQQLGVLDALVRWALAALRPQREATAAPAEQKTPYHYIGVLSFLSGILVSSSDTSDMDRHLMTLFHAVHGASAEGGGEQVASVMSSALARKTVIKVIRAIAVLVLRSPEQDVAGTELVETTIGFLLENLADNDTPVRFAASKALSIITLKLDAEMASQVVEAVLESLSKNILWTKNPRDPTAPSTKDLSAVDPLEWHGLMLTLSHLLYRRSPPAENLSDIIQALVTGLSFERRNAAGGSIGTNVRDAACFGIWALARRYSTQELLAVHTPSTLLTQYHNPNVSVLQVIATELIIAASLDPAGNIRRGSSAALQELIGRHPDTVEKGIWVVQTVDYHGVALRSRALQEVALNATKLAGQYGEAILSALLGWRGVGDVDAAARRASGTSYGSITAELASAAPNPVQRLEASISQALDRIKSLQARQVEERHGLLLSFAAVLDSLPAVVSAAQSTKDNQISLETLTHLSLGGLQDIMTECSTKTFRRPELIAEAASRLVISAFPVLQGAANPSDSTALVPGPNLTSQPNTAITQLTNALGPPSPALNPLIRLIRETLQTWLLRPEEEVIPAASDAGLVLLIFCSPADRESTIRQWADAVRQRPAGRNSTAGGFFSALVRAYGVVSTLGLAAGAEKEEGGLICDALRARWAGDKDIETRVLILRSLAGSELLEDHLDGLMGIVKEGLEDYTTNARGDVGSLVRFRAVGVTRALWVSFGEKGRLPEVAGLFLRILRLAAEKLDRVRAEAQSALAVALNPSHAATLRLSTFSSRSYFGFLLDLLCEGRLQPAMAAAANAAAADGTGAGQRWMEELMAGLVSSADTGNEDLVIATRAALCDFCDRSAANADAVCGALVRNLARRQGEDRVVVPTLEVIAFLANVGVFGRTGGGVDYKKLCLRVQKAGYKTGNVRKIEACVKVYGAIAALGAAAGSGSSGRLEGGDKEEELRRREEGATEARKRLGALMYHPWPRVRSMVVDELWGLMVARGGDEPAAERLKGVDWGKAEKGAVKTLVEALGLPG
ncbi:tubulin folding cofactor D C terminal-domain-containing protein [Lasiosphaeris hirsuta]|uniref:Tubulin folding cofactor D C terminal-domain-containing protein n=1 Tax=Lasiosphaeris hirsuta TaxID=260670 RepID=A0AA40DSI3_9PEZI|nr:tubulin folding cofactor D C terminal-domain-containing protein [Lasiosphaeris hirsuta]